MATKQYIAPFPDHINREHFASWFSGFADGEGSFGLALTPNKSPMGYLTFHMRRDDKPVLELIRSYFQFGHLYDTDRSSASRAGTKPQTFYRASNAPSCWKLVSHFEQYPLMAKKSRDFTVWRQGVEMAYEIGRRPRKCYKKGHFVFGRIPQWTQSERDKFGSLVVQLVDIRKYHNSAMQPTIVGLQESNHVQRTLFYSD